MIITSIEIGMVTRDITDKDLFMDNGKVIQLLPRLGDLECYPALSKADEEALRSFKRVRHEMSNEYSPEISVFSIERKV